MPSLILLKIYQLLLDQTLSVAFIYTKLKPM